MEDDNLLETKYSIAVQSIKTAILRSQYQAVKLVNKEQLFLYYTIGRYISKTHGMDFGELVQSSILVIDCRLNFQDLEASLNVI